MSELKTYKMVDEKYCTDCVCVIPSEVYIKSEADKVIAELKHKLYEAQDELVLWREGTIISEEHQNELDGKLHSDYKRCLAMAEEWRNYAAFCGMQSHCHNHRGFGKTADKYTWKECHAWKCVHRCKELAKKFKMEYENGRR